MTHQAKLLSRASRMSDADYPGSLCRVGAAWRVVVSPCGGRYRLQALAVAGDNEAWASPPAFVASSLSGLLEKCRGVVDGLAQACAGLPDDPGLSLPELVAQRLDVLDGVAADRGKGVLARRVLRDAFFRKSSQDRAAVRAAKSGRGS